MVVYIYTSRIVNQSSECSDGHGLVLRLDVFDTTACQVASDDTDSHVDEHDEVLRDGTEDDAHGQTATFKIGAGECGYDGIDDANTDQGHGDSDSREKL